MTAYDFFGKKILVTGANRGIGFAIAKAFLESGADLTIVGLEADTIQRANELSEVYGSSVNGVVCDVRDKFQVLSLAKEVGVCDVLINNAGLEKVTPLSHPFEKVTEDFLSILDINVAGMFRVTHAILPLMPDGSRIVNTSSIWGKTAVAELSAYCASKHAVIGLTRSLAHELAPRKISVNAVCPGWVETEGSMRSVDHLARTTGHQQEEIINKALEEQAFGGIMTPEDMSDIYLFLASGAARNITGQAYTIDRGEIMQ